MPVQGITSTSSPAVSEFIAAARARITDQVADKSDVLLRKSKYIIKAPDDIDTGAGAARTPLGFSGSLVDLRV